MGWLDAPPATITARACLQRTLTDGGDRYRPDPVAISSRRIRRKAAAVKGLSSLASEVFKASFIRVWYPLPTYSARARKAARVSSSI